MSNEYQGLGGSAPCQYAPLGQYTSGYAYGFTPQGKTISGKYIVPNYEPINHNSLVMSGSCAGYPNIMNAYGKTAGNCNTQYSTTSCGK
jgi:hypothetical protein